MKQFLIFIVRIALFNFLLFFTSFMIIAHYFQPAQNTVIEKKNLTTVKLSNNTQPVKEIDSVDEKATLSIEPTEGITNYLQELANHNSRSDCWIVYEGKVYDITPFFGSHPGGDAVMLPYCGADATVAFNTKGKIPANPHSENAHGLLSQYLLQ